MDRKQCASLNFNKEIKVEITHPQHFEQFIIAFGLGKFYLSNKYPLYLFPAQSNPFDIFCINKNNEEVSSVEMSIGYNPEKNAFEVERSELEAQYFALQREYVLKMQSLNKKM